MAWKTMWIQIKGTISKTHNIPVLSKHGYFGSWWGPNPTQLSSTNATISQPELREQMSKSLTLRRPPWHSHCRMQCMPHWHGCIGIGKLDRVGPFVLLDTIQQRLIVTNHVESDRTKPSQLAYQRKPMHTYSEISPIKFNGTPMKVRIGLQL